MAIAQTYDSTIRAQLRTHAASAWSLPSSSIYDNTHRITPSADKLPLAYILLENVTQDKSGAGVRHIKQTYVYRIIYLNTRPVSGLMGVKETKADALTTLLYSSNTYATVGVMRRVLGVYFNEVPDEESQELVYAVSIYFEVIVYEGDS